MTVRWVQSGDAHLVTLDAGDLFATSRTFSARPVLAEVYNEDGTQVHLAALCVHRVGGSWLARGRRLSKTDVTILCWPP